MTAFAMAGAIPIRATSPNPFALMGEPRDLGPGLAKPNVFRSVT
jgi:hypothetical protein